MKKKYLNLLSKSTILLWVGLWLYCEDCIIVRNIAAVAGLLDITISEIIFIASKWEYIEQCVSRAEEAYKLAHKTENPLNSKFGTVTTEYKSAKKQYHVNEENYPRMILEGYGREPDSWHPTQKNVALVAYLIRTYTNVGGRILDCCMGSGTTAVAAIRTNRNFIGFELNKEYFDKAVMRIENEKSMKETDLFGYGDLLSEEL